ncbi:hypothetical protein FN846DRAFT_775751 [Sphaerosporella brunnea]|uniref:Xylanolytic transcriptional activator regulatory domain-containing protein n=1 Tax=Sphaerosporella brunnea TaxID=1250544 RepID=A0A5J5F1D3_9PEZI|nr:hypothetical protein FN846DRAFT_775751 [Sphaerosporella brunnea]
MDSPRPSTNSPISEVKTFEWDEDSIDQYYSLIHPTFPLLPHSKPRLRQRLAAASITVREALLEALYAAVRSNPSYPPKAGAPKANPRRACELCVASQFESQDPRASVASSLLYLQTLILMALEADNHGPVTMRGMSGGPPRAAWVGSAVGLAYSLKLHHNRGERFAQGDPDSDERLGRRAWWVLVVLDRWHAISTSSPLFIPDSNVVLLPEDQTMIGLTPFHLVRLSCILGHLAEVFTTADEIVSAASLNPYICRLLRGELERFRESVEVVWGSLTLLHVAYYHVKLLTLRHNSSSEPRQLLEPALRMATMLDHSSMPITPLNHHFAALALITLVDLAEIDETRDEAWKGIQQLDEALKKRRGLATREDSVGWDRAIKDLISTRVESRYTNLGGTPQQSGTGSLQHLAELAIGDQSPAGGYRKRRGLDAGNLQKYGYLGSILL